VPQHFLNGELVKNMMRRITETGEEPYTHEREKLNLSTKETNIRLPRLVANNQAKREIK